MLKSLLIQNYVLIDGLDIRFGEGLSVITGETGAGKSIILGALSLVLGQRADAKSIAPGAERCVIEAVFDIAAYGLETFFNDQDLEYDAACCILRRELLASGKSRAFVNDTPVSLSVLKELGSRLIDIHSQHENLLLGDNRFQLNVVDVMGRNEALLAGYRDAYQHWQAVTRKLSALREQSARSRQEEDYIRFQHEQLAATRLEAGEQERWEEEQEMLSHAEEIKAGLYRFASLLQDDERGCLPVVKEALNTVSALERYFPQAKEMAERMRTAYIDLGDLASEADSLQDQVEFNPERLAWVNDRLNTLYSLQQKHHLATVDELLTLQVDYETRLQEIDSSDEAIGQLVREQEVAYEALLTIAARLSDQRRGVAGSIATQLIALIASLGIPNARFQVEVSPKTEPGPDGRDDIRFLFSANKNGDLQPVAQTASGGEISRLMLCIKAMIAGFTALPAIIFDEVDTGVSGDIASRMGDIMQELGSKMQVITITHLPQVAAKGKIHFFVYKEDTSDRTFTRIRLLDGDERIKETARMLSGATLTEAAIANARELLG